MSTSVLMTGLVVGLANYLFRYLPLLLGARQSDQKQRQEQGQGRIGRVLDGIGLASICALLVVSSVPEVMRQSDRLVPTLVGFAVLTGCFRPTRSIVLSTLAGALSYGIAFKLLA